MLNIICSFNIFPLYSSIYNLVCCLLSQYNHIFSRITVQDSLWAADTTIFLLFFKPLSDLKYLYFCNYFFAINISSKVRKLSYFTNEKCKFDIISNTGKVQSLFQLKDNIDHYRCVIYMKLFLSPKLY